VATKSRTSVLPPLAPERDLLDFIDASPTPYHAVATAIARLGAHGFTALDEREPWKLEPGARRYVVRGGSSVAALIVGAKPPAEGGFRLVGAHTDSPGLRLKPRPGMASVGQVLLDVEVYGSPILATWLDRDLSLAGRVVHERDGRLATTRVRVDHPVCRLSSLAIHLNRGVNEDGLKLDRHRHLAPALGCLDAAGDPSAVALGVLAEAAGCRREDLRGFDVALFDTQPGAVVGLAGEFVSSPRLDNLASCHAAVRALLAAPPSAATAVAVLFDHEEVGSETAEGAGGGWLRELLGRVTEAVPAPGGLPRALARSMLVSADMAHAVHPNHPDKHDGIHTPRMNEGPVVKTNAGKRYATDAETAAQFRQICRASDVPCQDFVTRGDLACGSTIGPIVSAGLGVRTVDVGNPMLSMHSARELAGTRDVALMIRAMTRFLAAADPLPW